VSRIDSRGAVGLNLSVIPDGGGDFAAQAGRLYRRQPF
jgi:hypothetical protein